MCRRVFDAVRRALTVDRERYEQYLHDRRTMPVIKTDGRLVLKSSTQKSLKHTCIEYCVEKREPLLNLPCLVVIMVLLFAMYPCIISETKLWMRTALIAVVLSTLVFCLCYKVHSETLLITAPIGLQMTTTYVTGYHKVFSLPWQNIADVLIVDVIQNQKVLYYLAIKTSQGGLVTLFQKCAPRLGFLEIMYRDVHRLLEKNK